MHVVRLSPTRNLSTGVGGFILVVNAKTFFEAVGISPSIASVLYVLIFAVWIAALAFAVMAMRRDRRAAAGGQAA